jgi:hypothetical protein
MATPSDAGRKLEILFTDQDQTLEVDAADRDPGLLAESLIQAIGSDDADEASRVIQAGVQRERGEAGR